jgi:hypothetical protein
MSAAAVVMALTVGAGCSEDSATDADSVTSTTVANSVAQTAATTDQTSPEPTASLTTLPTTVPATIAPATWTPATTGPSSTLPSSQPPSAALPALAGPLPEPVPDGILRPFPLTDLGYSMSEFAMSGTATSYTSASPLSEDGVWSVTPDVTAPFTTRIVVAQPMDPAKFSGTVLVEWFNVSAGIDAPVDWQYLHDEIIREGHAYVGVSAQAVGVEQLLTTDPGRYGTLSHPGDSFSYDIFSQTGMAVRGLSDTLLAGLQPTTVIAAGQSQSAIRLTTYVNAVAPVTNVFDGYFIHSRAGQGMPLSEAPQPEILAPDTVLVRDDLTVPVLTIQSETDVLGVMEFLSARQPDSDNFRLWEVAGTAHVDIYISQQSGDDDGSPAYDQAQFESLSAPVQGFTVDLGDSELVLDCPPALNAGQLHYVVQAGLHRLVEWITNGEAPESMPRLDVDETTNPPTYVLDDNGNVTGGVRTPAVDAPLATLSGLPVPDAPGYCVFFGQTIPFTPERLEELYPTTEDFVAAWNEAVDAAEAAGTILPVDATRLRDVASTGY